MSRRPRWGGTSGVQRVCARCGHGISDQRPVFLAAVESGQIVGPFHSGCLARLVDLARKTGEMPGTAGATNYGTYPLRREETLPE